MGPELLHLQCKGGGHSTELWECVLCSVEYLSKFSPAPSTNPGSFGGQLVERMAARITVFFMRHASLVRPLSQAGKVQLAKVYALPGCAVIAALTDGHIAAAAVPPCICP